MAQISYEQQIIDERILSPEDEHEEELSLTRFIALESKPSEDIDWSDKRAVEANKIKERLQKSRQQKEVAARLDISTAMLQKKLYHKDISRDWVIAICAAYGFDAYQTGEALYNCSLPCFDDSVKRDKVIQSFLNGHKNQPATLSAINTVLTDENQSKLRIQKRKRQEETKKETIVSPYKVIGPTRVRVRDYEGDPYNSLSTKYLPNQECEAEMLLQDDSGTRYLLRAFSDGKYILETEHNPLPSLITLDSDPSFNEYMLQLSEAVRKRKQESDDIIHDSRNFRGRYSANIKNDSIHVFYEEYNYWMPERNEYLLMEYCDGRYSLSISQKSMFMQEYLTKEDYYAHYHTQKRIGRRTYNSVEEIENILAKTDDWQIKSLLRKRVYAFNQLKAIVEEKLNAIRSHTVFINNIDFIWDNPADVLHYYEIEELFGCEYDPEYGEISKCQDFVCIPAQDGNETIITFDEVLSAFKLGFESFEQICRVKSGKGSIEAVLA